MEKDKLINLFEKLSPFKMDADSIEDPLKPIQSGKKFLTGAKFSATKNPEVQLKLKRLKTELFLREECPKLEFLSIENPTELKRTRKTVAEKLVHYVSVEEKQKIKKKQRYFIKKRQENAETKELLRRARLNTAKMKTAITVDPSWTSTGVLEQPIEPMSVNLVVEKSDDALPMFKPLLVNRFGECTGPKLLPPLI